MGHKQRSNARNWKVDTRQTRLLYIQTEMQPAIDKKTSRGIKMKLVAGASDALNSAMVGNEGI
jgi:hypothetical protein